MTVKECDEGLTVEAASDLALRIAGTLTSKGTPGFIKEAFIQAEP